MNTHIKNSPAFDALELDAELDFQFSRFVKLLPATAGEQLPDFDARHPRGRRHRFFDEIMVDPGAHAFTYARKPVLLYFYEQDWGATALQHLRQLNALRSELRYRQVNILVVTSGSLAQFKEVAWQEGLSLDVYEDTRNELAGLLRIYGEQSPAWSRYAGIERNIALPSLYLLGHNRQIVQAHPNEDILTKLPTEAFIQALPYAGKYWDERRSA